MVARIVSIHVNAWYFSIVAPFFSAQAFHSSYLPATLFYLHKSFVVVSSSLIVNVMTFYANKWSTIEYHNTSKKKEWNKYVAIKIDHEKGRQAMVTRNRFYLFLSFSLSGVHFAILPTFLFIFFLLLFASFAWCLFCSNRVKIVSLCNRINLIKANTFDRNALYKWV